MRVLLAVDKAGWSYQQIADALVRNNTDPTLELEVLALKGHTRLFRSKYLENDRTLIFGHQMLPMIPRLTRFIMDDEKCLVGIHSHHSWDPDLRTTPDEDIDPPKALIRVLKGFRAVNCVSQRLFNLFCGKGLNLFLTPNGVDCDLFKPMAPLSPEGPLRVGVAYTPKHDLRKGVTAYIRPACEKVGAVLVEAKARSDQHVRPEDMPAWHNSYDVYVCASSSEGFSIAVLEAAACGRVVISTRVGGSTELIHRGEDGFLVERSVDAIADLLRGLQANPTQMQEIGAAMRAKVEKLWSWKVRANAWLEFLRA